MSDLLNDMLNRPPADERPRHAPAGKPQPKPRRGGPAIGIIPPGAVERAFIIGLYLACLALVVLSVLGTFYGLLGASAPLRTPLRIIADLRAAGGTLGLALAVQAALTLTQYGARAMARRDRRWWLLYLAALAISVYYNIQAYYAPIAALANAYIAWLLIVAGDIIPEFIAVKRRD